MKKSKSKTKNEICPGLTMAYLIRICLSGIWANELGWSAAHLKQVRKELLEKVKPHFEVKEKS